MHKNINLAIQDLRNEFDRFTKESAADFLNKNLTSELKMEIEREKGTFQLTTHTKGENKTFVKITPVGFSKELTNKIDACLERFSQK